MIATLKDVAQAAGVDVSTASRALRDDPRVASDTRKRVRSAAEALGYRPNLAARSLRDGSTRTVWFLTTASEAVNERQLAVDAAEVLEAGGYDLLLAGHRDEDPPYERLLGRLEQGIADAALLVAGNGVHPESATLRSLLARRYPLVFLDRGPTWPGVPTVTSDNRGAARELVRRLAAAGIRRLVCCEESLNAVAVARREGALAEAAALGIPAGVASSCDVPAAAAEGGPLGVFSSQQYGIHTWCTRWASALQGVELRFACFDGWAGEPYPAPVAFLAIQDFAGMARRGAERLLTALADPDAWSEAWESLPILRFDEVRARL